MVTEHSTPAIRTCSKCKVAKPLTDFPYASKKDNERHYACKECVNRSRRQKRVENPARERAREQAYWAEHKDQKAAKDTKYREANRDSINANLRLYYAANAPKRRANSRAWYATHPEQARSNRKQWKQANPDHVRASNSKRKARQRGATRNDLTATQWKAIKDAFHHCCAYCGRQMQRLTMDHIVPISKGGAHTLQNVVPACGSCNSKKHDGPVLKPVQPLLLL